MKRIQDAGAEIRYNRNQYFRMFVGTSTIGGVLVLGTFDFNRDGMGMNRRDAGIHTTHPDLVKSAYDFFMKVWKEERGSIPLDVKFPDEKVPDPEQEQSSGVTRAVILKGKRRDITF